MFQLVMVCLLALNPKDFCAVGDGVRRTCITRFRAARLCCGAVS